MIGGAYSKFCWFEKCNLSREIRRRSTRGLLIKKSEICGEMTAQNNDVYEEKKKVYGWLESLEESHP
jgi:hypothetical protein